MIQSKLLLCADKVIREADTGGVSIIGILDDIAAESFPVLIHRFSIINFLIKDEGDSEKPNLVLQVFNNEKMISTHQLKIDFRGEK